MKVSIHKQEIFIPTPQICPNVLQAGMSSTQKEYSYTVMAQRNTQSFW